jgi:hypothetical protein
MVSIWFPVDFPWHPAMEIGEVGVYISNYAASFAAQYLGAAIIEAIWALNPKNSRETDWMDSPLRSVK